jgi:hypothetical protein
LLFLMFVLFLLLLLLLLFLFAVHGGVIIAILVFRMDIIQQTVAW